MEDFFLGLLVGAILVWLWPTVVYVIGGLGILLFVLAAVFLMAGGE